MIFKKIASIVLALVFTAIIIPCFTIKVAATNDTKAIIYDIDENTNDIITNVTIEKKGTVSVTAFDNKNNALNVEMYVKDNTNKSSLTFTKLAEGQYQYDENGTATIFKNQKSVYTNNGVINNFIYTKNEKGEPLPNVAVIFECGDIKEGKQSDSNGKIDISNLIDGNYKVHTVAVPSTYSNVEDIQIAISNGSVAEESAITIKNTVLKLQIEGISEPVDVLLEGENHSDQVQSTADGEALFLNIPYGDYVIKIGEETSEPKANISIDETYYNGDPVYISITQGNLIENDEENADVAEENTSSKKIIVYVLVFINNAAFITFIVFLKKRNEH